MILRLFAPSTGADAAAPPAALSAWDKAFLKGVYNTNLASRTQRLGDHSGRRQRVAAAHAVSSGRAGGVAAARHVLTLI